MNVPNTEVVRPIVSGVKVSDVAAWLGISSSNQAAVSGVTLDSRNLRAGDLWFALPGETTHAMVFASQAVDAGVIAVVTDGQGADIASQSKSLPDEIELMVVDNPRAAAGKIISRMYADPSKRMTVVGVTGTNGKTSVTHFVLDAWRANTATADCALLGTLGATVPQHPQLQIQTGFTTPEADSLQAYLAACAHSGVRAVAMEVSSHALYLHRVDGTTFDVVVFTNLSQDHLDLHGSMSAYFEAKARLFSTSFSSRALICIDDEWGRKLVEIARARDLAVTTYGFNLSDWHIVDCDEFSCTINIGDATMELKLPAPGRFTASNMTAAAAALFLTGADLPQVKEMMSHIQPVPGRMETIRVDHVDGPRVIVDYAHSPAAIETVLDAARRPQGSLIAVVGAGGDRDQSKRPLMGQAASIADVVVVTDDNPRGEEPAHIRAQVMEGVTSDRCQEISDRAAAIEWAIATATERDTVVILGKGAERGQTYAGRTRPFDDREQARKALLKRRSQ